MSQIKITADYQNAGKARHVFFDLDGTVVNSKQIISEETLKSFRKLKENKIGYSIASGRAPFQCDEIVKQLEITDYCSFLSGGIVVNPATKDILLANYFDPERLKQIKMFLDFNKIYYEFYYLDGYKISKPDLRHELHLSYGQAEPLSKHITDDDLRGVLKITLILMDEEDWEQHKILVTIFPDIGQRVGMGSKHPGVGFANVTCSNSILELAFNKLSEHYNLKAEEILAIGDANSDYDFVTRAGFGVAMGNSVPELKKAAKYLTLHVDEDGAALAFDKLCLNLD